MKKVLLLVTSDLLHFDEIFKSLHVTGRITSDFLDQMRHSDAILLFYRFHSLLSDSDPIDQG